MMARRNVNGAIVQGGMSSTIKGFCFVGRCRSVEGVMVSGAVAAAGIASVDRDAAAKMR